MEIICLNSTTLEHFISTLNRKSVTCQGLAISHDLQCNLIEQKAEIAFAEGQSGFSNTNITKDIYIYVYIYIYL